MTEKIIKVSLLGDSGVGKSAIVSMLTGEKYRPYSSPTIGTNLKIMRTDNTKIIIWDLAGSPNFQEIIQNFVAKSKVVLLCYSAKSDIASKTFSRVKTLLREYTEKGLFKGKKIVIVVTMTDTAEDHAKELYGTYFLGKYPVVYTSCLAEKGREKLLSEILDKTSKKSVPEPDQKSCILQ